MQRRLVHLLVATLFPLAALGLLATPVQAASPPYSSTTRYVAMGDSYSSGLGAPNPSQNCGRSAQGYPTLWASAHGITTFTDVTCAGAVTADVLNTQMSGLSPQTDVVTITIGGNDVGLGSLVSTCEPLSDQACAAAADQFKAALPSYMAAIGETYAAIRQAAPNAQVYVLGYPRLFETSWYCFEWAVPSQARRQTIDDATDVFVNDLAQQVAQAGSGFQFVDVRPQFAGHSVCSLSSWLNPVVSLTPLHPTATGYQYGYLAALTAVTG
jgi:lysophospholipase L1-like esterase